MFAGGLAAVRVGDAKTGKWGFIDKTGKFVINPQFDKTAGEDPFGGEFLDGLAAVRVGDKITGQWGFIDKTGKFVINPQFSEIQEFGGGLAAVRNSNGWGFIDKTGTFVITPQSNRINDIRQVGTFSSGLAAVRVGDAKTGKWGFIDKTGKFVINPQFIGASSCHNVPSTAH
jgi:hypothetical protein